MIYLKPVKEFLCGNYYSSDRTVEVFLAHVSLA